MTIMVKHLLNNKTLSSSLVGRRVEHNFAEYQELISQTLPAQLSWGRQTRHLLVPVSCEGSALRDDN